MTMTREEELGAVRLAQSHDPVEAYRGTEVLLGNWHDFVYAMANKRARGDRELVEDLAQVGFLGLMHAVSKFRAELGYRLMTYAERWIRHFMKLELDRQRSLVRMPRSEGCKPLRVESLEAGDGNDRNRVPARTERPDRTAELEAMLTYLPEKHAQVLRGWFLEGLKLHHLAERMGVTRQRVQQVKDEALAKLRRRFAS